MARRQRVHGMRLGPALACLALLAVLPLLLGPWPSAPDSPATGSVARQPVQPRLRCASPAAFATPASERPSADQLMKALGRELWVVGDELLTVSARLPQGQSLGLSAIALRNAADLMMDGESDHVQGELETAAVSSTEILPSELLQGLVDLFSYVELMPACAWSPAKESLNYVSNWLESNEVTILRDIEDDAYKGDTAESLYKAIDRLRDAALLFEPGGFKMPSDPRDDVRSTWGGRRAAEPEERSWREGRRKRKNFWMDEDGEGPPQWAKEQWARQKASASRQRVDRAREEALGAVRAAGGNSVQLLERVDDELRKATVSERTAVLRRLVKELHPDRNQGKEAEVMPVFRYVQQLRDDDK